MTRKSEKPKVISYSRTAVTKQVGDSLSNNEIQRKTIQKFVKKQRLNIVKEFDVNMSGYEPAPLLEVLRYAESNNIKFIVCTDISRLTRYHPILGIVTGWLSEDAARKIYFVYDGTVLTSDSRI